ncbi:pectate lyase [uncultured Muribaculum sp.]|uniref:pectate lyase n=1 Tax=uncultured Muribaculum sp. TaxID=1918613 RepID=UPI0025ED3197|nr:pectate lyase [uncultured Muribaculum sp.]
MKYFLILLLALPLMAAAADTPEKTPAFPGAEGFGRYTTGGRGGNVYHVTRLDDSEVKGTLRWALKQAGPRTIVFDVSGTIHLNSALTISSNTTLAGQTAPGDGICLADYPVSVAGNCIVRYMRFRLGNKNVTANGADGWDGLSVMDTQDVIIDHCSVSWSIDECCSILGNSNTTLQWSIIDQSLVNSGHSKGAHGYGGNWGGSGASFHHNLIAHHTSRTPRLGPRPTTQLDERMDMRNNVIYNFGGNGCYGGEGMNVNIVNNYYKPGPGSPTGTKGRRIAGVGVRTNSYCTTYPAYTPALHLWGTYFVEGNVNTKYSDVTADNWKNGFLNQIDKSASATDGTYPGDDALKRTEPVDFITTTTHSAADAYARVLDYAGASLSRDEHDDMIVTDAREGKATHTGSGLGKGFINSQEDNRPAGADGGWSAWPALESATAPVDTDGDGIPDAWETEHGLNPNNPADALTLTEERYTMLEVYLNSLVEHITEAQNEGGTPEGALIYSDPVAESYTICKATREGSTWNFGNGMSLSNTDGKTYGTKGDFIRMNENVTHTITLPPYAAVSRVKFEGCTYYTSDKYGDTSLSTVNGTDVAADTYVIRKNSSTDNPDSFEVTLTAPAKESMTFSFTGNNRPCVSITLYTSNPSSGIDSILSDKKSTSDRAWYTLQGHRLEKRPTRPGLYIHQGRKILIR